MPGQTHAQAVRPAGLPRERGEQGRLGLRAPPRLALAASRGARRFSAVSDHSGQHTSSRLKRGAVKL